MTEKRIKEMAIEMVHDLAMEQHLGENIPNYDKKVDICLKYLKEVNKWNGNIFEGAEFGNLFLTENNEECSYVGNIGNYKFLVIFKNSTEVFYYDANGLGPYRFISGDGYKLLEIDKIVDKIDK